MDIFKAAPDSKKTSTQPMRVRVPLTAQEKALGLAGDQPPRMADITWRIFRIMAEFVDGFQFLSTTSREVSIFGSLRLPVGSHWYDEAKRLGQLLGEHGFTVVTGGGPGVMQAANQGAYEAGAVSVGLNIQLPLEQNLNQYVTKSQSFHYFFTRKVMLAASSQAYIFFPGGFGTLDEMFEIVTLIQTAKSEPIPVILVGVEYWQGLIDWLHKVVYSEFDAVERSDLDILRLVDTAEEAFELIKDSKDRSFF